MRKDIKKRRPDYYKIRETHSPCMMDVPFYYMLEEINPGCKVWADGTKQHGVVRSVIRNRYGVPVALKVYYEEPANSTYGETYNENDTDDMVYGTDYISVDRITDYCFENGIGVWNVPRCSEEDGNDEYGDTPLDNDGVEYDLY